MHSKLTYFMIWSLVGVVLATSGVFTYVTTGGTEQQSRHDARPLADSTLLGIWDQQGSAGTYQLNVTPDVLFISSYDEKDICEIAVREHDSHEDGGTILGVIRLHRVGDDSLPLEDRVVKIKYERYNDVLKLTWDGSLDVLPRSTQHQLIAMPRTTQSSLNAML